MLNIDRKRFYILCAVLGMTAILLLALVILALLRP